jgi:hypothetical protein
MNESKTKEILGGSTFSNLAMTPNRRGISVIETKYRTWEYGVVKTLNVSLENLWTVLFHRHIITISLFAMKTMSY